MVDFKNFNREWNTPQIPGCWLWAEHLPLILNVYIIVVDCIGCRVCLYISFFLSLYIYQWRLVSFQPGDAVQKSTLHFFKFYFNLRFFFVFFCFFCNCHRIRHHFRYFSNLTLDFFKLYFRAFVQNGYGFAWVRIGVWNIFFLWPKLHSPWNGNRSSSTMNHAVL